MDISGFEDTIRGWVTQIVPAMPVIFLYPNAPRPTTSYVGLNVFQYQDVGTEEHLNEPNMDFTVDITTSTPKNAFVSVNVYYGGAVQYADQLVESLKNLKITEYLTQAGIGFIRTSNILKIPEEINKSWEDRAQFDVTFFIRSDYVENVETIRSIDLDGLGNTSSIQTFDAVFLAADLPVSFGTGSLAEDLAIDL